MQLTVFRTHVVPALVVVAAATLAVRAGGDHDEPSAESRLDAADFHATDRQLADLIDDLLRANPDLAVAESVWRARVANAAHGRALPDPSLRYTWWASPAETRVGPQRHTFELNQTLPWKGKRRSQVEAAELAASGASLDADARARALVAALKVAYYETAYLHEALLLNGEERELLERFEAIALKRYATGEGIQQSVVKVQTAITRLADERTRLRQGIEIAWARMAELVGRADGAVGVWHTSLPVPDGRVDREALEAEVGVDHPEIRASEERIESGRAVVRGGNLRSRPDFTVGLAWSIVDDRRDAAGVALPPENNGQDIVGLRIGLNLPIWKKHREATVDEAEARLDNERQRMAATRNRLRFTARESILRVTAVDERRRLYADVLIPQAREALGSAEAAYATNRIGFLDLLDAERVLFEVRRTYHRLIADAWIALAQLEQALGRRFPAPGEIAMTQAGGE